MFRGERLALATVNSVSLLPRIDRDKRDKLFLFSFENFFENKIPRS